MPNRLAGEISPYLLQHADNPVDWHPWGPEAHELARSQDKPVFLSIGYSACHWCHVMAHESFEDSDIARQLNEGFISIKVDREERPDLDQIYMEAVQMMTGRGGWPLSVFLTPSLKPFYGGTYWPPEPRVGMPGFAQVLQAVADAWNHRREEATAQATRLTELLRDNRSTTGRSSGGDLPATALLDAAAASLARAFDRQYGGFSGAPKFPHPMDLRLLLRTWQRTGRDDYLGMVTRTLDKMAGGGMYDHLGGGFHRYSTDERWLVPHFEKMLYDNALLAVCYLEAWQATGNEHYAGVVRETLDYVLREMTGPEGGFYSTEDADSEGEEGKFYVWTREEVDSVLGPDRARTFAYVYDVSAEGNFEGRNILNLPKTIEQCARVLGRGLDELQSELRESRGRLFVERSKRVRPGLDDKVLTSWNGLMIDALARAGAALGRPQYLQSAAAAARFLLEQLRTENGRLLHCWRRGDGRHNAYLEDYAALAGALVTLYESAFDERWIEEAVRLVDEILDRFQDRNEGGFFFAASDHEPLIARKKDMLDSAVPSGGGLAAMTLLRLGKLGGRSDYLAAAEAALAASVELIRRAPMGAGQLLLALDTFLGPTPEIVVLGSGNQEQDTQVLSRVHRLFVPNKVVAFRDGANSQDGCAALSGLFEGKEPIAPGPTVFVCQDFACKAPVSGKDAALAALAGRSSP
jgi:uncharacterized protein YyaL (SSP411 family)